MGMDAGMDPTGVRHRRRRSPGRRVAVLLVVLALLGAADARAQTGVGRLQLDPHHTVVAFHLSGRLHDVHGTFQLRQGTLEVDPATGAASGSVVVDAHSGESGNTSRDGRMASVVLEAERFPEMRFRPSHVDGTREADGTFRATLHGTLTLHGSDHAVAVAVDGHLTGDELSARGRFTVPYVEWGLTDPSMLLLTVAKTVDIDVTTAGHVVWTSAMGEHQ
jgi:polyisoprenoid-binding protein YceI